MDPQSIFLPARTRVARKRKHVASSPPAMLNVIGVQDLVTDGETLTLKVVFDTTVEDPLGDVSGADPTKWSVIYGAFLFECVTITAVDFNRIALALELAGDAFEVDQLIYTNAPSDMADTRGRQLAAFGGVPV